MRSLEAVDQKRCVELYWECIGLFESEDRIRFGVDALQRFCSLCIKSQLYKLIHY
jgi:hypothetical protein